MSLPSISAALGSAAADYTLEGAKWGAGVEPGTPGGVVTYSFATGNFGDEPFRYDAPLDLAYQAEVRAAFSQWSTLGNIAFQEVPDSQASEIRIGWDAIDGSNGTLGQTYYTYQDGHLLHTWIGLDSGESYAAGPAGPTLADGITFETLAEHEIGHAIGLGHYEAGPAIMNHVLDVNAMQQSDVDGVQSLYGVAPAPAIAQAAPSPAGAEAGALSGAGLAGTDPWTTLLADFSGATADDLAGLTVALRSVREHLPSDVPGALDVLRAAEPDIVAAATPAIGAEKTHDIVAAFNDPNAAATLETILHDPAHHAQDWFLG